MPISLRLLGLRPSRLSLLDSESRATLLDRRLPDAASLAIVSSPTYLIPPDRANAHPHLHPAGRPCFFDADSRRARSRRNPVAEVVLTEKALAIHRDALLIDGHNDLPYELRARMVPRSATSISASRRKRSTPTSSGSGKEMSARSSGVPTSRLRPLTRERPFG